MRAQRSATVAFRSSPAQRASARRSASSPPRTRGSAAARRTASAGSRARSSRAMGLSHRAPAAESPARATPTARPTPRGRRVHAARRCATLRALYRSGPAPSTHPRGVATFAGPSLRSAAPHLLAPRSGFFLLRAPSTWRRDPRRTRDRRSPRRRGPSRRDRTGRARRARPPTPARRARRPRAGSPSPRSPEAAPRPARRQRTLAHPVDAQGRTRRAGRLARLAPRDATQAVHVG
jgi:hypothetical protein